MTENFKSPSIVTQDSENSPCNTEFSKQYQLCIKKSMK